MLYKRGEFGIAVEQIDGFGKMPGLWVCEQNCMCKVASFGSEEKAKAFITFMDWILFGYTEPEEEKNNG